MIGLFRKHEKRENGSPDHEPNRRLDTTEGAWAHGPAIAGSYTLREESSVPVLGLRPYR